MIFEDRLKVTATSLSSQTLAVGATIGMGAALSNCRTLATCITDGASDPLRIKVGSTGVPFSIDDGTAWQDCECTITSTTQITVTKILNGSNGTNAATFSSSTPTVYNCVPGNWLTRVSVDSFPTAFSTTVPLTQIGMAHMPRQQVAGNLTFTSAAGAVKGAFSEYPMIYDGSSTLTFTGFTEHESSSGLPTASGIPFTLFFWYDGYTYWWSASKAANPIAIDIVAPTMTSAAVANATPATVTLTASEALDSSYVPAASAFTISGHTVLAVTGVTGTSVTLSVSAAFVNGEAAQTVSYTQPGSNGLRDSAGNLMASFTALAITNNVQPVDSTPPSFSSAQVTSAAPTQIVITMNETLANSVPPTSAFTVSGGKTVSGVSVSGTTVTVTVNSAYVNGDTITISYAQPGANPRLQDAAGNATTSFGPSAVTNNVAVVDSTAPTFSSAQVANATPAVVQITMSETLANSIPPNSAFSITENGSAKTVSSVSISGAVASVTCSAPFTNGTTIQVSYTQPGTDPRLQDAAGNPTATFGPSSVTNNVAAAGGSYPQLTSLSSSTSQTGTGPYTITGSGVGTSSDGTNAIDTEKGGQATLTATGDFSFDFQVLVAGAETGLGLRTLAGTAILSNLQGQFWLAGGSGAVPASLRRAGGATVTFTPQAGDIYRYTREGSTTKMYVQRNGTGAFTLLDTQTSITTAKVWLTFICTKTNSAKLLAWSGFA